SLMTQINQPRSRKGLAETPPVALSQSDLRSELWRPRIAHVERKKLSAIAARKPWPGPQGRTRHATLQSDRSNPPPPKVHPADPDQRVWLRPDRLEIAAPIERFALNPHLPHQRQLRQVVQREHGQHERARLLHIWSPVGIGQRER